MATRKKASKVKKSKKVTKKKVIRKPAKKVLKKKVKKTKKMKTKKAPAKKRKVVAKKTMKKVVAKKTATKAVTKKVAAKKIVIPKGPIIGKVTHFYDRIGVGVVAVESTIRMGDMITLMHAGKAFTQKIVSMQQQHTPLPVAQSGQIVGIKLDQYAAEGTKIYAA